MFASVRMYSLYHLECNFAKLFRKLRAETRRYFWPSFRANRPIASALSLENNTLIEIGCTHTCSRTHTHKGTHVHAPWHSHIHTNRYTNTVLELECRKQFKQLLRQCWDLLDLALDLIYSYMYRCMYCTHLLTHYRQCQKIVYVSHPLHPKIKEIHRHILTQLQTHTYLNFLGHLLNPTIPSLFKPWCVLLGADNILV